MNTVAQIVDSVEIELLGRRGMSFASAAKRSNWTPEPSDRVCWRCAGSVGPHETDGDGCASCRGRKLHWDRAIRLGKHSGIIRDAVLDLKFRRWRKSGMQLGHAMGDELTSRLDALGWRADEVLMVPIPMTYRRRLSRGIDHTRVLARGARSGSGIKIANLLVARHRGEQVGLTATDRAKNIRGGFTLRTTNLKRIFAQNQGIRALIVVDDVRTTGATMGEACKVLRKAISGGSGGVKGVEIWALNAAIVGGDRAEVDPDAVHGAFGGEN